MKSLPGDEDLTGDQQESKANQQISIRAKLRLTRCRLSSVNLRIPHPNYYGAYMLLCLQLLFSVLRNNTKAKLKVATKQLQCVV